MSNLIENIHYYINEEGLFVFSAQYHLEKGYCCGNGCLHCPYHYENVPEPKKTELLKEREQSNC
ncbi:MAG: hypothetical protein BWZ05_01436 [Bacteroidetes bacterium ADurb.BinA245]|jgi:hypothetical protein|nr:hypothetical protein [Chitinophagaceae bacterium]OPZ17371.1 MAG: hypothetical protein BWZ05_01431 [Bacteroidetes bacterium ADurb.BinA245]OPZ17376.1 MAG: hypothetical protein BWZ05_01436 [Bacteroidetes bacterium ADurb.BinA245]HMW67257.1 DUF5522 domain-containing protein [Chitinophagaceae bacterium]HMX78046.1 DUF5522 domain-containing protein [Chitinophagaceae bacterium]